MILSGIAKVPYVPFAIRLKVFFYMGECGEAERGNIVK